MLIPNSEVRDAHGNVTHFGIVDPTTGEPALIPHVGGNYAMFGGGSGMQTLSDQEGGGSGGVPTGGEGGVDPNQDVHATDFGTTAVPTDVIHPDTGQVLGASAGASGSWTPPSDVPNTQDNGAVPAYTPPPQNNGLLSNKISKDTTTSTNTDPKLAADYSKQADLMAQAETQKTKAEMAENGVRVAAAEAQSNIVNDQLQAQADARAKYQSQVDAKNKEIQAATDKFNSTPIDANHFWADKSTGDKVMSGIAIALGALGGALQGTNTNVGLDVINKAIDRDMKTQELNMQKSREGIEMKRGLLSDYVQQYGDMEKAKEMASIAYQKGIAQHFESLAMQSKDPAIQANGLQQAANIKANADMKAMELSKQSVTHEDTSAPLVKPIRDEKATKQLIDIQDSVKSIDRLQNQIKTGAGATAVGSGEGLKAALGDRFGFNRDADKVKFQADLGDTVIKAAEADGKIRSPEEREAILRENANISNSPQVVSAKLDAQRQRLLQMAKTIQAGAAATNQIVPNMGDMNTTDQDNAILSKRRK